MRSSIDVLHFGQFAEFPQLLCAVSTRSIEEVSSPGAGLNVGFATEAAPEHVAENRVLLANALSVNIEDIVSPQQVHGCHVEPVQAEDRGRGARDSHSAVPNCDALTTTARGTYLLLLSADCPLVTLFAPPDRGVALAHSGWRSTATQVAPLTAKALCAQTGCEPSELRAAIAPSIGPCCFEVGPEVIEALDASAFSRRCDNDERYYVSLRDVIAHQLTDFGLVREHIEIHPDCTHCDSRRYYSYRRDGSATGRIAVVAGLRGDTN